jgi:hypothetical protein
MNEMLKRMKLEVVLWTEAIQRFVSFGDGLLYLWYAVSDNIGRVGSIIRVHIST